MGSAERFCFPFFFAKGTLKFEPNREGTGWTHLSVFMKLHRVKSSSQKIFVTAVRVMQSHFSQHLNPCDLRHCNYCCQEGYSQPRGSSSSWSFLPVERNHCSLENTCFCELGLTDGVHRHFRMPQAPPWNPREQGHTPVTELCYDTSWIAAQ